MSPRPAAEETVSVTPTLAGPPAASAAPSLLRGQVVCDRFEILRLLGRGGIGEVYEAIDQVLGTRVALKVLRSQWSSNLEVADSLRQEVLLARQVTHPNVCRVFDVFLHHPATGPASLVIAMELIDGESLAARLRREGPWSREAALPLLRQIADGLDAAHAAGVVHHDLKPANVLLPEDRASERAVISDFGQAVSCDETAHGTRGGTLPYVAPEVLAGEPASAAVDVYAFGILMLELTTGRRPAGGAVSGELEKLLAEAPLPKVWRRAITRATDRDPQKRPRSASAALATIDGRKAPASRHSRALAWSSAVLATAAAFLLGSQIVAPPEPTAPVTPLRTVGFLPVDDSALSEDQRGFAPGLAQLIAGELAAGGTVLVRTSAEIAEATDARVPLEVPGALPAVRRLAADLGCDAMIQGAVTPIASGLASEATSEVGDPLELSLQLVSATAASPGQEMRRTGTMSELMGAVPAIAAELRRLLGTPPLARAEQALATAKPRSIAALLLYGRGRESLRRYDPAAARRFFEQATAADPDYALAHAALAETLLMLGDNRSALASTERAVSLSRPLRREQRLTIEALDQAARESWQAAADIYRALVIFFPQNPTFGHQLAVTELANADAEGAMAAIEELRTFSTGSADLALTDLLEAQAAALQQDFRHQLEMAERALGGAGARDAPMIRAGALRERGGALHSLGRSEEAQQDIETARQLYRDQGNLGAYAEASNQLANVVSNLGDVARAETLYREALALFRQTGSERREARALSNLALLAHQRGDTAQAERMGLEALELVHRIGYHRLESTVLNNLARVLLSSGKITEAIQRLEQAVAAARQGNFRGGVSRGLADLVGPYLSLGQPAKARRAADELDQVASDMRSPIGQTVAALMRVSLAIAERDLAGARAYLQKTWQASQGLEDRRLRAAIEAAEGELAFLAGDLPQARASFDASWRTGQTANDLNSATQGLLGGARTALWEGRADDGLRLAREARRQAERARSSIDQARAEVLLAEAQLRQGEPTQAARTLDQAHTFSQGSSSLELQAVVGLAEARLARAQGQLDEALGKLVPLCDLTKASGFSRLYFEALLLRAEVLTALGRGGEAEVVLAELEKEARQGGFGLFVREIERLRPRSL